MPASVTFRRRAIATRSPSSPSSTPASASSKNDLERIFQPFERARTAGAKATIGTGLGLTITSLLTKIMGGDISVKSEVGKGTTFRVKLLPLGGAAPAHRLDHGIPRARL